MICVYSVKEGTDFSPIGTVVTFSHARVRSLKHTHSGPVFEQGNEMNRALGHICAHIG